jgi:glycerol-3-phosphate cytidylyltransferase
MSVVLTMGTFDMFHIGHLRLLEDCSRIAGPDGLVWVGVNSDDFAESYKRRPTISEEDRKNIVFGLDYVSGGTFLVEQHDASEYIRRYEPDFLVIGEDWAHKDYLAQIGVTEKFLQEQGICLLYRKSYESTTTSKLIERIKND